MVNFFENDYLSKNTFWVSPKLRRKLIILLTIAFILVGIAGCKHEDYVFPPILIPLVSGPQIRVSTLEDLIQVSNNDYNLNQNGLVTETTITRWWNNWNQERPEGITGRLVFLHLSEGTPTEFIRPKELSGVFSYRLNDYTGSFNESRFTGVLTIPGSIPQGEKVENFLNEYGIQPDRDLIVLVPTGTGSPKLLSMCFRVWFVLRYWGIEAKNLAILNGSITDLTISPQVKNNFTSDKVKGNFFLSGLLRDNTVLQATLGDVKTYLERNQFLETSRPVRIVDARSLQEYDVDRSEPDWVQSNARATPWLGSSPEKYLPMEGRIRNAISLPETTLLESVGGGFRLKSLSGLETDLTNAISGSNFRDSNIRTIVYSRRGERSSLVGFVFQAVIGVPTAYYENGWTEWGIHAGSSGSNTNSLPNDSSWRTDRAILTEPNSPFEYNVANGIVAGDIQRFTVFFTEAFAERIDATKREDKNFIRNTKSSSGGPLGSRPGNPCG